jgi:hypothetical protein
MFRDGGEDAEDSAVDIRPGHVNQGSVPTFATAGESDSGEN